MKIAHAREKNAPAGTPFHLFAADNDGTRWLDLEVARRRAAAANPNLAHNSALFRQPITTLDDHLARGLRVDALAEVLESFQQRDPDDDALADTADLKLGPPLLRPTSLRDFYAFERHVATVWSRRDQPVPEAWYRLPIFYFSNVSEIRGPEDPVWAPAASNELDFELELCALIDTPVKDLPASRGEEAVGGYMLMNDWSARDLQRDETTVRLGPAKGKDFATTIGPWLTTPDELSSARQQKGFDLSVTATVNGTEIGRGNWSDIHYSFGDMVERASADVRLVPGDLIGSGTVGSCCLLESREASGFGRYLEPADVVTLRVDRLGELKTSVVARPEQR